MRHLITVIVLAFVAVTVYLKVDWEGLDFSRYIPSGLTARGGGDDSSPAKAADSMSDDLYFDTIMCAEGHALAIGISYTSWDGLYFDTVCVGHDNMLRFDSVGPSSIRLWVAKRALTVNLGDKDAAEKIRAFLGPYNGYKRLQQRYEERIFVDTLDSGDIFEGTGTYSILIDYPDTCMANAGKIKGFICELTGISDYEKANVPALSAFYAGYNPTQYYRAVYTGDTSDMQNLADFLAHRTFENWRGRGIDSPFAEALMDVRPHVANDRFVTFSKYEFAREDVGHGMYVETFHTYDIEEGKALKNTDIFKRKSLDKVKLRLFETMADDPLYVKWEGSLESSEMIEGKIEAWQSPSPILEGTEWEEPEREVKFELPEAALTDSGVVFSFQPYEISCFAAGAFHFTVPYDKLLPYMTPRARRLVGR